MKNYFKKFSIMFVMSLILVMGSCISALADDQFEIGKNNLNGTVGNSATKDVQLIAPEKGWGRYDDTNSKIVYNGDWGITNSNNRYKGVLHYTTQKGASVSFKFNGSKLRLICESWTPYVTNVSVKIDNLPMEYFNQTSNGIYQCVSYQNLNLSSGIHNVVVTMPNGGSWTYGWLDAIDIDDTGYLLPYNESISLDRSSMDLTVNDSKQLTATTTPAGVGVVWKSSNTDVAKVNETTGEVTAGSIVGTCTITATTNDGSNLSATCEINVTEGTVIVDPPVDGDGGLFIELVDGNIKKYDVSSDEINKFINWYNNRDNDDSQPPYYKFTKDGYKDYVVHDKIDWFEVR